MKAKHLEVPLGKTAILRERETERQRERQRQTETERETERDRERETETDRGRERETERERQKQTEAERETDRNREGKREKKRGKEGLRNNFQMYIHLTHQKKQSHNPFPPYLTKINNSIHLKHPLERYIIAKVLW